ncbi:MAG: TolC family protein [Ruminococcus flavefaciens]|nr:TolC family protein [Ruminococcus flavefaciens]
MESHWEYIAVKKELLPELSFTGTLPQINRSFTRTTLSDGRETFVPQFYGDYEGGLRLTQFIPYTNTRISVSSGLERLDLYGINRTKSYLATPFNVSISQSLFTYNASKWEQKINPIKYSVARQKYMQEQENIHIHAIELYFEALLQQEQYTNAQNDRDAADTIHAIAYEKFTRNTITESDYLQIKLSFLQAEYEQDKKRMEKESAENELKDFLALSHEGTWFFNIPTVEIFPQIDEKTALHEIAENNPLYHEFLQREWESKSNLAQAKSENRFSMEIYASFSLNQNAEHLPQAYASLLDREMVSVGLQIPLLDWGKAKSRINKAKVTQESVQLQIHQEKQTIERELRQNIAQFVMYAKKLKISKQAYEISTQRAEMERLQYTLSKISFTEYRDAITQKNDLLNTYISDLKQYWILYYTIRKMTLYDFTTNQKLEMSATQYHQLQLNSH